MGRIWRTVRTYIWWTHERGGFHYDVMVTLILLFIFLAPHWINFKDKPVERTPHQTRVVLIPDGQGGLIYQVDAAAISNHDEDAVRNELLRVIEPIAGEVTIERYVPVTDAAGRVVAYKAWISR